MLRFVPAIVMVCYISIARAVDKPPTLMTDRGELLLSEDLSKPVEVPKTGSLSDLKSGWRLRPGKWEFVDGVLRGTQLEEDHHGGVASVAVPFSDAIIQVDCRFDGCRRITVRVNTTDEHVCRVTLDKKTFSTQKDDCDHEGPDEVTPFGELPLPVADGQWKTVLFEILDDEVVATIDGKSITGSHPWIATPKANVGLVVSGGNSSASFRNLRIWQALPNPAWPENKVRIEQRLKTRSASEL